MDSYSFDIYTDENIFLNSCSIRNISSDNDFDDSYKIQASYPYGPCRAAILS
jgi:hypothetical protein